MLSNGEDQVMKRVVVLGGGFAGLETAIHLRKRNYDVTLVSDRDYFYIYPISIWVPTRATAFEDVCIPMTRLQKVHGFELVVDRVEAVDISNQQVVVTGGTLDYDILVVAVGADKVQHAGSEHFLSICGKPEAALQLQEKLDALLARGHGKIAVGFGGNPLDRTGVRGGPAFEVLFNFHNLLRKKKLQDKFELTFFAPMARPGERLGEKALGMMDTMLARMNIQKRVGTKIKAFQPDGVLFEDESRLDADLVMFIPSGAGKRLLRDSGLPLTEAGFVKIDETCQVVGIDNVYAVGDIANIEGPDWRAKQGHLAEVMARNVAFNIDAKERGSERRKTYRPHLSILCVMDTGNGAAFVYRDHRRGVIIPLPILGHWLKKAWGAYFKLSKLKKIPRIPGM